jgi:thiol-disulfide isomerase/thioredoxin
MTSICFTGRLAVLAIALSIILHAQYATAARKVPLRVGEASPIVALRELNGSVVRFPGHFRGKAVILHFWAGGCSSCKEEMPGMESLYNKYRGKGLVVLAVNVNQPREMVKKLVRGFGVTYPVLLDTDGEMAERYDVAGLPRTFLIDRNGVIRCKIVGPVSVEILEKRILGLL